MKFLSLAVMFLVSSVASAMDVTFIWDPATGDSRVAGYELHYGTAPGTYTQVVPVSGIDTDTVMVTGLDSGTDYWAAVRSVNSDSSMVSPFSNEVPVPKSPGLLPPANLQITVQLHITVN